MIVTLASLFGGLSVALRIVSPLFVKFILYFGRPRLRSLEANEEGEPTTNRVHNFDRLIYPKVTTVNLFETTFTDVQDSICSTR
ncbi:unnamed protein product, partial [Rotaria sp. Silwood2]